jgi:FtsP/CotA-like multicopper oxidase with cupredoxin domain
MGGMAGALIIEGETDAFLRDHGVTRDRVFVLQAIKVITNPVLNESNFLTPPMYTINGRSQPTIHIRPGEVQRWRFINASEHEHMPLVLRADAGNARQTFHQLACDGITLPKLENTKRLFLASGNRVDVLMKIDKPGVYRLIKPELFQGTSAAELDSNGVPVLVNNGAPVPIPEEFLATVIVAGRRKDTSLPRGRLPRSSTLPPIRNHEINGNRRVTFSVDFSTSPIQFLVDGKLFDPNRVDQRIALGAVEEWTVLNTSPSDHPFHIHQNAFVVTEINGDRLGQPAAQLPLWLDTVNVPRNEGFPDMSHPGSVTFRSRFEDFDGKFVLHCHLIHHSDMGMMQVVEIVKGDHRLASTALCVLPAR